MDSDRRHHPRFTLQLPVVAELPDGHRLHGTTCDLSHQGARLRLNHRLPSGIYLMLELNPPGSGDAELYTLWANVLHSRTDATPGYELGIQYAHPPGHYLQLIERLAEGASTQPPQTLAATTSNP